MYKILLISLLWLTACGPEPKAPDQPIPAKGTYGYDIAFLSRQEPGMIELRSADSLSRLILSPKYQGRVMTSTAAGDTGLSFGWVNYDLIASQKFKPQFNPVGGEERFWLGPEGGQFGLYFPTGDSFTIAHWQVPPVLDTLPFRVTAGGSDSVLFSAKASLRNHSGAIFDLSIDRRVRLLNRTALEQRLGLPIPATVQAVAYTSQNEVTNTGRNEWKKETGLLSIWLLGMMIPSSQTVVFIPFAPGTKSRSLINSDYFGAIPLDRLYIGDSLLYFRCDGKSRGKLGLSPRIAGSWAASYDFRHDVLTMLLFRVDRQGFYVNSKWEKQKDPYGGDAVNAYNDGPLANGSQLGPFYEIESSSAAGALKPGETMHHEQTTCHLQGSYAEMKTLVKQLTGVDLDSLKKW